MSDQSTWSFVAERTWTQTGKGKASQANVKAEIDRLEWHDVPCTTPAGPGLAVDAVKQQLDLPGLRQMAWNGVIANRYGLYGIECHYRNGRARIYILDRGSEIVVMASDFWPKINQPEH